MAVLYVVALNLHLKLYSNTSVQKGRGIAMPVCLSTQKAKYNYNVHSLFSIL